MLSATELHERGRDAVNAGRPVLARRLLGQAAERTDDPDLRARIELSLAYLEAEQGDLASGLALCRRALRRAVAPLTSALVQSQIGVLHVRAGDSVAALKHLHLALDSGALDELSWARALLNRGLVHLQCGRNTEAADDFDEAAARFEAVDAPVEAAQAVHNAGFARLRAGDLVAALDRMAVARPVLAELSPISRAVCDQDRAEVLVTAGLVDEAAELVGAACEAYGASRWRQSQAEAELLLARLLLTSDPARSRLVARRAVRRFLRRGSASWALRAELVEAEAALALPAPRARHASTLSRLSTLASELRSAGLPDASLHADLLAAREQVLTGEPRPRLPRPRPTAPMRTRLLHREVRALRALASGRPGECLGVVADGLDELHLWLSSYGNLDLQSALAGHGRDLAVLGIRTAVASGDPATVLDWSERARALASRVLPLRPPSRGVPSLTALRGTAPESFGHDRGAAQSASERMWRTVDNGRLVDPVRLDDLAGGLGPSGTLVAHLYVDGELSALVVSAAQARLVPLGPHAPVAALLAGLSVDLDMHALRPPGPIGAAVEQGLRRRLEAIDDVVLRPLEPHLGDRVVLTPTSALSGVPWPMLPSLRGRVSCQALSATRWMDQRPTPVHGRVGLVAGPDVPRAQEEVRAAADAWSSVRADRGSGAPDGPTVLVGSAVTSERVADLAANVDVLHLSAHGRHSAEHPLFSGVRLVDGTWFGHDVDALDAVPRLVVLSACEMGRSTVRWREEAVGMAIVWLHAGTGCVIAAPAQVNDDDACEVLRTTHALMADGELPAVALARAREASAPTPFLCFGAGW